MRVCMYTCMALAVPRADAHRVECEDNIDDEGERHEHLEVPYEALCVHVETDPDRDDNGRVEDEHLG